jgi:hypothetical protein
MEGKICIEHVAYEVHRNNPRLLEAIFDWVERDIELFLTNGVIKAEDVPEKREELLVRYFNFVLSNV